MLRVLDRLSLGNLLYSPKSGVIAADEGFAAILERPISQILGICMKDVTHPDDLSANEWLVERALKTGGSFTIRKRYKLPSLEDRWVENRYTAFRIGDEAMVAMQSRPVNEPANRPRASEPMRVAISNYALQMIAELERLCASAGMPMTAELLEVAATIAKEEVLEHAPHAA